MLRDKDEGHYVLSVLTLERENDNPSVDWQGNIKFFIALRHALFCCCGQEVKQGIELKKKRVKLIVATGSSVTLYSDITRV